MTLGTFAPGYYAMTYDASDCGLVEGPRRLRRRHKAQIITADKYGDTAIDGVYRGGDCFLACTFKEWIAPVKTKILNPYEVTDIGAVGEIGELITNFCKQIILTAQAGSPAATAGPATLTADLAILAPENDIEVLMGNVQRDVPVLFQLFPYLDSGVLRWFKIT